MTQAKVSAAGLLLEYPPFVSRFVKKDREASTFPQPFVNLLNYLEKRGCTAKEFGTYVVDK